MRRAGGGGGGGRDFFRARPTRRGGTRGLRAVVTFRTPYRRSRHRARESGRLRVVVRHTRRLPFPRTAVWCVCARVASRPITSRVHAAAARSPSPTNGLPRVESSSVVRRFHEGTLPRVREKNIPRDIRKETEQYRSLLPPHIVVIHTVVASSA